MVVFPYLHDLAYYRQVREVRIEREDHSVQGHGVRYATIAGDHILLSLEGCGSREAVRPLIGQDLQVPRAELPPVGDGECYWFDLEGLVVYTDEERFLGRVTDFFPTGSNEVLVVRDGPCEVLIPFIRDVIIGVDERQGCLRVRAMPGLL